jgi:hypothetical protein
MRTLRVRIATGLMTFTLVLWASIASAQSVAWTRYNIPQTGTSVDIPSSIFTKLLDKPDGYGERLGSSDGRADLTIQSMRNSDGTSPEAYLNSKNPPSHLFYKRVTPNFFAVSGFRGDNIWYDRCNFSASFIHCVLINFPADEKPQWEGVVTRISRSLSGASQTPIEANRITRTYW